MIKKDNILIGRFKAIESFFISPDNQFGVIGDMLDGVIEIGAFAHISLNKSFTLSVKIEEIKEIQFSREPGKHKLITFFNKGEDLNNFMHAMNVCDEIIEIRTSS